ncbi:dynein regulatory complex protein 9-like [Xenia sp. Carnegie-2017]|uniref:dynein regulatory complex protein 9-like n=1 Tax=Xenia sp. Carnegie-2017 TaxID=2897299 RepID=UPI001F0364A3|nr:dynein regulatory complex protein 9-like [Xenia sp. Carnegie-2017]XP_046851984.1 dynein regulatory complex protein 9-like [Xenia sp. Carnegie-2017]
MDDKLSDLDAIYVSCVLEDCLDQLAILGTIMPSNLERRANAEQIVDSEIAEILEGQRQLESKFENLVLKREKSRMGKTLQSQNVENDKRILQAASNLRDGALEVSRSFKNNPLSNDNIAKTQADRKFLQDVIQATLEEVNSSQTFQSLTDAVNREIQKKEQLQQTILREEESRKAVKTLQRQLVEVRKQKEQEIQQRNEMIAHLKDQLQEMKAKASMEGKYIRKDADVRVSITQKICQQSEDSLKQELEKLQYKIGEESRVNEEIESYLRTHHQELEEKVEYWMEKYDKDVEAKQHELDVLKASKAHDLSRLQELTQKYSEYEKVVIEDRIEKEKLRRQAEQEEEELKATINIQSWWRGVMVRRQLGPYSLKKKKKGKKGKSAKKGGKGKKK